ncbi:MAG: hypothetical protein CVU56_29865, partial [Deltaproteobacteria bacterium HGW-Deltaproteobacteria-14]
DPAWDRFVAAASAGDLLEGFASAAAVVGAEVVRVTSAGLEGAVAGILAAAGATRPVFTADCGLARAREGLDAEPFERDAGVTGVAAAVARSGTLVLHAGPGCPQMASLAPPLHVAIVRAGQIVGALSDYLTAPGAAPSARVLVTGPSKTADIEGILITGVHGPARLVIVLVADAPER